MLSGALPKNASRVLSAESYPVRVSVVERFLTDAATSKKRAIARRADPPDAYWARLAEEARGLDRQYISGTWRPGRAGRTLRDWEPYTGETLAGPIINSNQLTRMTDLMKSAQAEGARQILEGGPQG